MALKAGRHTGAKEYEQARRSGVFAAAPAGLAIGTPPHAGLGKAAVFSNRARVDDTPAPWDEEPADRAAIVKARGTSYLRPHTPAEVQVMTADDMRALAVAVFEGELEAATPLEGMKAVKGKCDEWQEAAYCADVSAMWWVFFFTSLVIDEYFSFEGTWGWKMDFGFRRMKLTRKNLSAMPGRMTGYMVALGMVIALDKIAYKKAPISETASRNQPESADKKPAVLPQSLQSAADVTPTLADADKAIDKALSARGAARVNELLDDVRDGLINKKERVNRYGVVELIDGHWLRWGGVNVHLENSVLIEGVVVQRSILVGAEPMTDVRRGEIIEWLEKVQKAKRNPPVVSPPFPLKTTAPIPASVGAPVPAGLATTGS